MAKLSALVFNKFIGVIKGMEIEFKKKKNSGIELYINTDCSLGQPFRLCLVHQLTDHCMMMSTAVGNPSAQREGLIYM